jgi:hypothetical protein
MDGLQCVHLAGYENRQRYHDRENDISRHFFLRSLDVRKQTERSERSV